MARTVKAVPRKNPLRRLRECGAIHWAPGLEPNPAWAGPSTEVPDPSKVVLKTVDLVRDENEQPSHLVLTGEYDGNPYRTTFKVKQARLLTGLYDMLRKCEGQTIEEIGAHAVDRSLGLN